MCIPDIARSTGGGRGSSRSRTPCVQEREGSKIPGRFAYVLNEWSPFVPIRETKVSSGHLLFFSCNTFFSVLKIPNIHWSRYVMRTFQRRGFFYVSKLMFQSGTRRTELANQTREISRVWWFRPGSTWRTFMTPNIGELPSLYHCIVTFAEKLQRKKVQISSFPIPVSGTRQVEIPLAYVLIFGTRQV